MKNVLVTGGAGYIGSHTAKMLKNAGYIPLVFDNLSTGYSENVKWGELLVGDLRNREQVVDVFSRYNIHAVMHFAACAYVGESMSNPGKYYENNVISTLNLLSVMIDYKVNKFIFSSTCATYGSPVKLPIDENHPQEPINPYGKSKLMIEEIIKDYSSVYDFRYVSLRYFNACGADSGLEVGENHEPETHLIPLVLDAALGIKSNITIFGDDYKTKDGTCIRDYVHVEDLATGHIQALSYLETNNQSNYFNLSNGDGYSVKEIINSVKKNTNLNFRVDVESRRHGDPAILIGSSEKAKSLLKWDPKYKQLDEIIKSAWAWHTKLRSKVSN